MEDIATDDDLLSDMLLDSLEFEPKIATHKMNQAYRSPRYKTQQIIDIVRQRIVIDGDLAGALEALCEVDVIRKHMSTKSPRQRAEFQAHARRYLETYMPESGVEFALTMRYKRTARQASMSNPLLAAMPPLQYADQADVSIGETSSSSLRNKQPKPEGAEALGVNMADLCVVATRPFKAGELISMCKGGVKDLTKSEDEALREEAAMSRERRKEAKYAGVLGPGRDFSIIRSARKGCSQLLLGPARFVNHDCDPNCEFHRVGQSTMVFRCLRDVGINEEITTYYGDNYFEVDNAECMCLTCERRGTGIFAPTKQEEDQEQAATGSITGSLTIPVPEEATGSSEPTIKARRTSTRKGKSPPPQPHKQEPTVLRIERNGGKVIEKAFAHHVSSREFDPFEPNHKGPQCTCLTCGSAFWAPEAWWLPDECRRCERHFKIYQGDWPGRVPTEPKWMAIYTQRRVKRELVEMERRRKQLDAPSPGQSGTSDIDTPVKMSPMRDEDDLDTASGSKPAKRRSSQGSSMANLLKKKKRRVITSIDSDEEMDESTGRPAAPVARSKSSGKANGPESAPLVKSSLGRPVNLNDEDDDLSDLTSVSATNEDGMSRSASSSVSIASSSASDDRPCGPKMLGKHAKTETLAMFWGAPTSNKRERKQRPNGLESLSDTVKVSGKAKHRRTVSDMSSVSNATMRREQGQIRSPTDPSLQAPTEMLPVLSAAPINGSHGEVKTFAPIDNEERADPRDQSSTVEASRPGMSSLPSNSSLLATHGPARTSVKNLAMAWGAGVEEGGRGSRRRLPREMGTPVSVAIRSPKAGRDTGSLTPPSASSSIAGRRTSLTGGSNPILDTSLAMRGEEGLSKYAMPSASASPAAGVAYGTPGTSSYAASISNVSSPVADANPVGVHQTSTSGLDKGVTHNGDTSLPSPAHSDRSASPGIRANGGSPVPSTTTLRNGSPLAGPATGAFVPRAGAVPGRKNLRWGKGKVSQSRPLVGAGSPLAGPAASIIRPASGWHAIPIGSASLLAQTDGVKAVSAVPATVSEPPTPRPIVSDGQGQPPARPSMVKAESDVLALPDHAKGLLPPNEIGHIVATTAPHSNGHIATVKQEQ